jgi:hypothetical protein
MMTGSNRRLSLNVLNIYQKNKTTVQYGAGTPRRASRSMNYGIQKVPPPAGWYSSDSDESSTGSDKSKTWRIPAGIPSIPQLADFSCCTTYPAEGMVMTSRLVMSPRFQIPAADPRSSKKKPYPNPPSR